MFNANSHDHETESQADFLKIFGILSKLLISVNDSNYLPRKLEAYRTYIFWNRGLTLVTGSFALSSHDFFISWFL